MRVKVEARGLREVLWFKCEDWLCAAKNVSIAVKS